MHQKQIYFLTLDFDLDNTDLGIQTRIIYATHSLATFEAGAK